VISIAENAEVNPMRHSNVLGIDFGWRFAEVNGDVNHAASGIRCPQW
jgi:hypothetical protein